MIQEEKFRIPINCVKCNTPYFLNLKIEIEEVSSSQKKILNPNCSELVTHIGGITREEIVQSLQKIAREMSDYGLTLGVALLKWGDAKKGEKAKSLMIPIPEDAVDRTVMITEKKDFDYEVREMYANLDQLVWYWAHKLAKSEKYNDEVSYQYDRLKATIGGFAPSVNIGYNEIIRIFNIKIEEPKIIEDSYLGLDFSLKDSYAEWNGLTFGLTQHCCTNEFSVFHAVREIFNSDYEAHDGGSVIDYEQWMNYWFRKERGFTHHSYRSTGAKEKGLDMITVEHPRDEDFEKNPPLRKTTDLNIVPREIVETEQEAVDALFSEGDYEKYHKKKDEAEKKRIQVI